VLEFVVHAHRGVSFVNRGRIHSVGTHEELLRANGLYAHLARLQLVAKGERSRRS